MWEASINFWLITLINLIKEKSQRQRKGRPASSMKHTGETWNYFLNDFQLWVNVKRQILGGENDTGGCTVYIFTVLNETYFFFFSLHVHSQLQRLLDYKNFMIKWPSLTMKVILCCLFFFFLLGGGLFAVWAWQQQTVCPLQWHWRLEYCFKYVRIGPAVQLHCTESRRDI